MTQPDLSGKVAVVTGASSGIGLAVARELHALGMRLVLTARREDRLARARSELKPRSWSATSPTRRCRDGCSSRRYRATDAAMCW